MPAIWLVELLLLLGITTPKGLETAEFPYCEKCGSWTDGPISLGKYPVESHSLGQSLSQARGIEELIHRPPVKRGNRLAGKDPYFLKYDFFVCQHCQSEGYLSISHGSVSIDKHGDEKEEETLLWKHVVVAGEAFETLQREFGLGREGG